MIRTSVFLFSFFLFFSCSSSQESFQKGNYKGAFRQTFKKVKKGSATSGEKQIMTESLRKILAENRAEMLLQEELKSEKGWRKALLKIEDSKEKVAKVEPYISYDFSKIKSDLEVSENRIVDDQFHFHFDPGMDKLENSIKRGEKLLAQKAFTHFKEAKKYSSNLSLIDSLQDECIKYGKEFYALSVDPDFGLSFETNTRADKLLTNSTFLEVSYDSSEDTDCEITLKFYGFDIDESEDETFSESFDRNVVVDTEIRVDTSGEETEIPIFGDVSGAVEIYEYKKEIEGNLRFTVNALTENCLLSSNRFSEEIVAEVERVTISGDERAIPEQYEEETFPDELPSDSDMEEELLDVLFSKIRGCFY